MSLPDPPLINEIAKAIEAVADAIRTATTAIKDLITNFISLLTDIANIVKDTITILREAISEIRTLTIDKVITTVKDIFTKVYDTIRELFNMITPWITQAITGTINTAVNLIAPWLSKGETKFITASIKAMMTHMTLKSIKGTIDGFVEGRIGLGGLILRIIGIPILLATITRPIATIITGATPPVRPQPQLPTKTITETTATMPPRIGKTLTVTVRVRMGTR